MDTLIITTNIVSMVMSSSACKDHEWGLGSLIVLLIGGVIIGLLGKLLAPGDRDSIPFWLTIVCGIGGVLIGTLIYGAVWGNTNTNGIDWWRHIWQVAVAAVLVMVAATVTGRSTPKALPRAR
jgi:uncharacterized membrane protein YeaQ/YmgE (transglycosylase-associated protein family)